MKTERSINLKSKNIEKKGYVFLIIFIILSVATVFYFNYLDNKIKMQDKILKSVLKKSEENLIHKENKSYSMSKETEDLFKLCSSNKKIFLKELKKNDNNNDSLYAILNFNGDSYEFKDFLYKLKNSTEYSLVKSIDIKSKSDNNIDAIITLDSKVEK